MLLDDRTELAKFAGEIADAIGRTLRDHGLEVDVSPAHDVRSLNDYDAVVLGSAVYTAHWRGDASGIPMQRVRGTAFFTKKELNAYLKRLEEAKERDTNYSCPLFVTARFMNRETGEIKEQQVFLGDFPMMTDNGTFIINGTERVVVSQLVRSPGVYFDVTLDKTSDKDLYSAKVIPGRGAWLEFDVDKKGTVGVRVDRKRRQFVTTFIRALGLAETDPEILDADSAIAHLSSQSKSGWSARATFSTISGRLDKTAPIRGGNRHRRSITSGEKSF